MKIKAVNPGAVIPKGDKWQFTTRQKFSNGFGLSCIDIHSTEVFDSPNAAKQAMREHVAWLRKKHCV